MDLTRDLHYRDIGHGHLKDFAEGDLAELLVHRDSGVVQRWCLEDDATGASDAGQGEDPEEEAVQDHRDEFPVFHDLDNASIKIRVSIYGCTFQ